MGIDINSYLEIKNDDNNWDVYSVTYSNDYDFGFQNYILSKKAKNFWFERNYVLFGVLSDTRNKFQLNPISKPRGFPEDVSEIVKNTILKASDLDNVQNDISWITLQELIDYTKKYGSVLSVSGYINEKSPADKIWIRDYYRTGVCDMSPWSIGTTISFKLDNLKSDDYSYKTWESNVISRFIDTIYHELNYGDFKEFDAERIRIVFYYDY